MKGRVSARPQSQWMHPFSESENEVHKKRPPPFQEVGVMNFSILSLTSMRK
jgi:hypothetical protein